MSGKTRITLPSSVPFPVTVSAIKFRLGDFIKRRSTLLVYKYWSWEDVPDEESKHEEQVKTTKEKIELMASFECPVEGELVGLYVGAGDRIASDTHLIAEVQEACTHDVQFGGLCAVCGKVLDEVDYSGYDVAKRAPIAMSHGRTDLKISLSEAERIEQNSAKRLLKEERLILVVDLDQTVIHATVDPTVGEWMKDPSNPNYPAVKDVQCFSLQEEVLWPARWVGPRPPPHVCWYYVKLRPGTREFLESVSTKYELHIYTMATRAYARNIAKIIDPDGRYFGDRILSRDESGSLTQKSLKRLFPVDTSMVVVIDDRGDVWNWSDNLIKVVPYDFFVGIGDINSSFLPRQAALLGPSKRRKSVEKVLEEERGGEGEKGETKERKEEENLEKNEGEREEEREDEREEREREDGDRDGEREEEEETKEEPSSPVDRILELGGGEDNANLLAEQTSKRSASLEQQQHDRPLAKLQHDLEQKIEHPVESQPREDEANLLCDDDNELESLGQALVRIHNEFYFEYEGKKNPDVKDIMKSMKRLVFQEYTFLFSGILPLGSNLDTADIVIWARSFGANVVSDYTASVTHVICRNAGTFKVKLAKSLNPSVRIVNPDWFFKCISLWEKVAEDEYEFEIKKQDLLSPSELENFKKKSENFDFGAESLNWTELDKEVEEFLSSSEDESEVESRKRVDDTENDNFKRPKNESDDDDEFEKEFMLELES